MVTFLSRCVSGCGKGSAAYSAPQFPCKGINFASLCLWPNFLPPSASAALVSKVPTYPCHVFGPESRRRRRRYSWTQKCSLNGFLDSFSHEAGQTQVVWVFICWHEAHSPTFPWTRRQIQVHWSLSGNHLHLAFSQTANSRSLLSLSSMPSLSISFN